MKYRLNKFVRLNASLVEELASEKDRQTTIPVFPLGEFEYHHDLGEGFELTPERIEEFVENFENGVGTVDGTLPVYAGHGSKDGNDRPAVGWVRELMNRGEKGLWAVVEWTDRGMELVKSKAYRFISPEWTFAYYDPREGKEYGSVLFAPALVNEPYFNNMPAITASEQKEVTIINNEAPMNLEELLQKPQEELTEEEKAFIAENTGKEEEKPVEAAEEATEATEEVVEEAPAEESTQEATEEPEEATEEASEEVEEPKEESEGEEAAEEAEETVEEEKEDESKEEATEEPKEEAEEVSEGDEEAEASEEEAQEERLEASETKMVRMTAAEAKTLRMEAAEYRRGKIVARLAGHTPAVTEQATELALELEGEEREKFLTLMASIKPSLKRNRASVGEDVERVELSMVEKVAARAEKDGITKEQAYTKILNETK